jgi:hypothetical protein
MGTGCYLVFCMKEGQLTPALDAELRFLRQQVDFWQQAYLTTDASPSAKNRYRHAKDDLTQFVGNRRKEGYKI